MAVTNHHNPPSIKVNKVNLNNYPMRGHRFTGKLSITLEGVTYNSIKSAALAYNIDHVIFEARLYQGMTPEEAAKLVPCNRKHYVRHSKNHHKINMGNEVVVNGTKFISYKAAAAHFGIKYRTFSNRLNLGYTPEQAAKLESRYKSRFIKDDLVIEGINYPSISSAARAYGISKQLFHLRLKQGLPLEACAGIKNKRSVDINGVRFANIKAAAEHYGVKPNTVSVRLRRGKTLEQALGLTPKGT